MLASPLRALLLCVVVGAAALAGAAAGAAPARAAYVGPDWQHALLVAQSLRAHPPQVPVIILLGGSSAREATSSDTAWAAQVRGLYGGAVLTYDLGSQNQTFEQDVALVKSLPKIPILIYIGINRGRFANKPSHTKSATPVANPGVYDHHHYQKAYMWSLARKQAKAQRWMAVSYPLFESRFAANLKQFDALVTVCRERGYQPVVLELPRNTAAIGHAFDKPQAQYADACRALAGKHDVPFLDFVGDVGLTNSDFRDLDHVYDSGRRKFQGRLSRETVQLLFSYEDRQARDGAATTRSSTAATTSGARFRTWEILALTVLILGGALVAARLRARARLAHGARNAFSRRRPGA